jgi:hypothetical protein
LDHSLARCELRLIGAFGRLVHPAADDHRKTIELFIMVSIQRFSLLSHSQDVLISWNEKNFPIPQKFLKLQKAVPRSAPKGVTTSGIQSAKPIADTGLRGVKREVYWQAREISRVLTIGHDVALHLNPSCFIENGTKDPLCFPTASD